MEGNHSTAYRVLPEYIRILTALRASKTEHSQTYPEIGHAIDIMMKDIETYQDEALRCDAIIIATTMHPRYRLQFFSKFFPDHVEHARSLLERAYDEELARMPKQQTTLASTGNVKDLSSTHEDILDDFSDISGNELVNTRAELTRYLDTKTIAPKGALPLAWWKVCFHSNILMYRLGNFHRLISYISNIQENHSAYPVVSRMARDYFACTGTSCACERAFSAAGRIATANRSLAPRTIERAVGCHQWLSQGVKVPEEYGEAFSQVQKVKMKKSSGQSKKT